MQTSTFGAAELTVSYCITCKARLAQLQRTLTANLQAEQGNDVEFVVLDYDCPEGTSDWVKASFPQEIASGRILVARHTPAPNFKMAHAKNMAHRLASRPIVCNLDADNFIAKDFSRWLVQRFTEDINIVITTRALTIADEITGKITARLSRQGQPHGDLGGRIAIARANFERLGGYDEKRFSGHGPDDVNFGLRGLSAGLKPVRLPKPYWGDLIHHTDEARLHLLSDEDRRKSKAHMGRSRLHYVVSGLLHLLDRPPMVANGGRDVGCGNVTVNFDPTLRQIGPLGGS